ncbi:hypothetical protein J4526_06205 [Desulfurococcaceae archaeon MEX13E-LK6-19]|nr:hypothetical protein J4526_06205 [Desulfurococcaceae archaeon MEX13E-LK6-19]
MPPRYLKKVVFFLLLVLAYLPAVFVPAVNSSNIYIGSIPLLWIYMMLWTLYAFGLLVTAYVVDKKLEW